jgi:hypothetical protein
MDRFIAGDRARSSPEGAEMLTGVDPPLDGAVVLKRRFFASMVRFGSVTNFLLIPFVRE